MKKIISTLLAMSLILIGMPFSVNASSSIINPMNMQQLKVAASYFVWNNIKTDKECVWDNNTNFMKPIPLYDSNENIISYYIKTIDGNGCVNGYLVVNSSYDNPCVLEYGYGEDEGNTIDTCRSSSSSKVQYKTMGLYNADTIKTRAKNGSTTDAEVLNFLNSPDAKMQKIVDSIFSTLVTTRVDNEDFGIINLSDLPSSGLSSVDDINGYINCTWAVMSDAPDLDDHCGPTSGTNVLKYYQSILGTTFVTNNNNTITALHGKMNTGGAGTTRSNYGSGLSLYVNKTFPKYQATFTLANASWSTLKRNVNNNKMTAIYLWAQNPLNGAHYVNVIGYREYKGLGKNYARILNNWERTNGKYILFTTSTAIVDGFVTVTIKKK